MKLFLSTTGFYANSCIYHPLNRGDYWASNLIDTMVGYTPHIYFEIKYKTFENVIWQCFGIPVRSINITL